MTGPEDIRRLLAREGRAVVMLVTRAEGSTPRGVGAAMALGARGGVVGTVGGGAVEHEVLALARELLAGHAQVTAERTFPLGPDLDQCCGGRMDLAFAVMEAGAPTASQESTVDTTTVVSPRETSWLRPIVATRGGQRATAGGSEAAARGDGRPLPDRAHRAKWGGYSADDADGAILGGGGVSEPFTAIAEKKNGDTDKSDFNQSGGIATAGSERTLELWPGGPVLAAPRPGRQVFVYGAGHVGRAVIGALGSLPFRLVWVDAQSGRMAAPAGVEQIETALPEATVAQADDDAMHLVLTHSHALDLEIVAAILARPFGFCGLIGSATKRALFDRRLEERGLAPAAVERLTCPIGLPGLRDKRPEVIATSVAAQLLLEDARIGQTAGATR